MALKNKYYQQHWLYPFFWKQNFHAIHQFYSKNQKQLELSIFHTFQINLIYKLQSYPTMHFYPEKDRTNYTLKMSKRSSKQGRICSNCSLLKKEVKQLRELHQKLTKEVKNIIAYIPRQIDSIINKITAFITRQNRDKPNTTYKSLGGGRKIPNEHRQSSQQKQNYSSKLKLEDGIIKESIFKELKVIRALESKQKDLRIANQKHETLRKSLSKESINSTHAPRMKKLYSSPKLVQNPSQSSLLDNVILKKQASDQNQWINSPKFGQSNEDSKFQAKIRYSSYDSKSIKKSSLQGNTISEQLICPNGHQFYNGDTLNHVPHGFGTLINCCSRIPFKINPKTLKYTGSFKHGQFQGKGTLICKDNVKFQGSFSKGMRHGQGVIYLQGASQKGVWDEDKLVSFK